LQACGKARFTLRSSRDLLSGKAANRRDEPNDFSSLDRASDQPIILARSAGRMVSGWRRCIHENLFDSNTRMQGQSLRKRADRDAAALSRVDANRSAAS